MPPSIQQIGMLILGLILIFFGLSLYKTFVKAFGFVVGAAYGIYAFNFVKDYLAFDVVFVYLLAGLIVLMLGIGGALIAQFANTILFFLAGGMVGLMIGKILAGLPPDQAMDFFNLEEVGKLIAPKPTDLFWFLGGGIVFVIALDALVMLALTILGCGFLWVGISPMKLFPTGFPSWIPILAVGVIGLSVQESSRKRYHGKPKPKKVYSKKD